MMVYSLNGGGGGAEFLFSQMCKWSHQKKK